MAARKTHTEPKSFNYDPADVVREFPASTPNGRGHYTVVVGIELSSGAKRYRCTACVGRMWTSASSASVHYGLAHPTEKTKQRKAARKALQERCAVEAVEPVGVHMPQVSQLALAVPAKSARVASMPPTPASMEAASRYIESNPGVSQSDVVKAVRGNSNRIRLSVHALVADGYVENRSASFETSLVSLRPFRAPDAQPAEPPTSRPVRAKATLGQEALFDLGTDNVKASVVEFIDALQASRDAWRTRAIAAEGAAERSTNVALQIGQHMDAIHKLLQEYRDA